MNPTDNTATRPSPRLAVVVPCYNEQEALPDTHVRLRSLIVRMCDEGLIAPDSYILYVNDGSRDATWTMIKSLCDSEPHVAGLGLAANAGHQRALMAGLECAVDRCDVSVSIDADLQDDIEAIPKMIKLYRDGADIVYGVRECRDSDTRFKRTTAQAFYRLMHSLGVKSVYNHADFRLMSARAMRELCRYHEVNLFLRGIVPLLGFKQECVYYTRHERTAGESKYPLAKMLNFAVDGITSFSIKPVRLIFILGLLFMVIAFGILVYALFHYMRHDVVPGWTSIILSIWFCTSVLLMCMGVLGEYVGKMYAEVKHRPRSHIDTYIEPRSE